MLRGIVIDHPVWNLIDLEQDDLALGRHASPHWLSLKQAQARPIDRSRRA
jgi:hypothetical protein